MKELYAELFNKCRGLDGFCESSNFVAITGDLDHQQKRFMLIGRACNGWDDFSLNLDDCDEYSNIADIEFYDRNRWGWIKEYRGALYSGHTDPPTYCVSQKPFWDYSKSIWQCISGKQAKGKWMEDIAWSNLYKVSPAVSGNPEEEYKQVELDTCKKILIRELELIKPTHIFMPVGYYGWFEDFKDIFSDVKYLGSNVSRGKNKNTIYVEAIAKWKDAKVVISCRPEYRDKESFVEAVSKAFL